MNQLKSFGLKYKKYDEKSHMENLFPIICEDSCMNVCKCVQSNSVLIFPAVENTRNGEFLDQIQEWYLECEQEGRSVWYHSTKEAVLFFSSIYGSASQKFFSKFEFLGFRRMNQNYIDIAWSSASVYKHSKVEVR